MADAARFPHLALPFAITGAAGGWLSAGLVQQPVVFEIDVSFRLVAAGAAAVLGAATGALLRRWCVGPRYGWQLDAPDPGARPPTDAWPRHVLAILVAGAAVGALSVYLCDLGRPWIGALSGLLCTLPFVPICAGVLSFARRAQRARLGSIVAGSDRRAVWSLLAATLLMATLEALPDWCLPRRGFLETPYPAFGLTLAAVACVVLVLALDVRALRRATRVLAPGLAPRDAHDTGPGSDTAARVDLGLGADVHARLGRGSAPYRSRERTLALVLGDPERSRQALWRAVRRGVSAVLLAAGVLAAHFAAGTRGAFDAYQEMRCARGNGTTCAEIARQDTGVERRDFMSAVLFFQRGCDRGDPGSCLSVADMYSGHQGLGRDAGLVALFEYRAAQRGVCPPGQRLVRGAENVCVGPGDPRQ